MNILAIECATEVLSVALWSDARLRERVSSATREHGRHLLPTLDGLIAEAGLTRAQVDAIAFGQGPGAFTGVRMAVAAAQGLAYGLDKAAVPVSSLAALAQEAFDRGAAPPILALLDARMGELYVGRFEVGADGLVVALGEEELCTPQALALPGDDIWCAAGPGWQAQRSVLSARFGARLDALERSVYPQAGAVARLAQRALREGAAVRAHAAQPVYLRDKVAYTEAERAAQRA